jgi:hypothetical protein
MDERASDELSRFVVRRSSFVIMDGWSLVVLSRFVARRSQFVARSSFVVRTDVFK